MPEPNEKPTMQERTKELTDRLEAGMKELFQSDKYKDYLKSMSHFHNYSSRNIALINMQMPGATRVASFKLWDEQFNRHVKKGEHGIRIFAPIASKQSETKLIEKLDPETGAPLLDGAGKPIVEEMTLLTTTPKFKLVPVFDISQTYGDPLPELVENLTGNVEHYSAFLDTLKAISPLPITFEAMPENKDGYCRYGEKIGIREGMSEIQTVTAVVHEITHARLHDKNIAAETASKSKIFKEIEAESVAYVVCQHYGIETAPNSFGYLAEYGSRDMSELKASLDTIRKEANSLINAVDGNFKTICKERGIYITPKEAEKPIPAVEGTQPTEPSFTMDSHTENIAGVDFTVQDVIPQTPETELSANQHIETIDGVEFVFTTATPTLEQTAEAAKEPPKSFEPAETMPDPAIGVSERDLYGYNYDGMLPLTQERALELFDDEHVIYLLYEDNTEAMALDRSEIEGFGGIFGIDRDEWQRSLEYTAVSAQNSEAAKESELIHGDTDMFAIYQLKDGDGTRDYRFEGMSSLESRGLSVEREHYSLVYTAPLLEQDTLNSIFHKFNVARPEDFTGHSLSVSDVVVMQRNGEVSSHFVDSAGFAELSAFLGNEKQPEKTVAPVEISDTVPVVQENKTSPTTSENKTPPTVDTPQPPPSVPESKNQPVYPHSPDVARSNDEMDIFHQSRKLNVECAKAIDTSIKDSNYELYHYDLKTAAKTVTDEYGADRVAWVLANTIQKQFYDGRYSSSNQKWAKGFDIPEKASNFFLNSHPAIIDGFISRFREAVAQREKPSILEAIKSGNDKSRQLSDHKQEAKKSKEKEM